MGWTGSRNGPPLELAARDFDLLLTADQNLEHQQNVRALPIAVAVLVAESNRMESLRPLVPELLRVLPTLRRGDLIRVSV
jgi:hypothetical protein